MRTVVPDPKPRSSRWISTSIPEGEWESDLAQMCSADYHTNNAISPVLFYEALQKIPANAVTIEIAPHCLMNSILRRSLHKTCTNVGLMNAKEKERELEAFLQVKLIEVNFDKVFKCFSIGNSHCERGNCFSKINASIHL